MNLNRGVCDHCGTGYSPVLRSDGDTCGDLSYRLDLAGPPCPGRVRYPEDARALPTDPHPSERICAWCRGELDEDRGRLCRSCTNPVVERTRQASTERQRTGPGPWAPPGAVAPPRQCIRCLGGLTAGEPDGGPCGSCRHFEAIAPARPQ